MLCICSDSVFLFIHFNSLKLLSILVTVSCSGLCFINKADLTWYWLGDQGIETRIISSKLSWDILTRTQMSRWSRDLESGRCWAVAHTHLTFSLLKRYLFIRGSFLRTGDTSDISATLFMNFTWKRETLPTGWVYLRWPPRWDLVPSFDQCRHEKIYAQRWDSIMRHCNGGTAS